MEPGKKEQSGLMEWNTYIFWPFL